VSTQKTPPNPETTAAAGLISGVSSLLFATLLMVQHSACHLLNLQALVSIAMQSDSSSWSFASGKRTELVHQATRSRSDSCACSS